MTSAVTSAGSPASTGRFSRERLAECQPFAIAGRVRAVRGLSVEVGGLSAPLGALCEVDGSDGVRRLAEVIGFRDRVCLIMPYGDLTGLRPGDRVGLVRTRNTVRVGPSLLGRTVDAFGQPLDDRPAPQPPQRVPLAGEAVAALRRPPIDTPLATGIRALDGFLTCGRGQRIGLFAGSGVGKSTLMGQIARSSDADVNVIVLVGERGREVREFLERDLGADGRARSVVVVATSDEPALAKIRAAEYGSAVAEAFRDDGRDVLLMMDSVTRYALAKREVGLAAGEPPATRGFPPSVFASLPRLLERSGRTERGSITAFYTVLVEGDDPDEPISDAVRGILDGHVMLTRELADRGHWPAVDVLRSVSRVMPRVAPPDHADHAAAVRRLWAKYRENEDLVSIGAYQAGTQPELDKAINARPQIEAFLRQTPTEQTTLPDTQAMLGTLASLA